LKTCKKWKKVRKITKNWKIGKQKNCENFILSIVCNKEKLDIFGTFRKIGEISKIALSNWKNIESQYVKTGKFVCIS